MNARVIDGLESQEAPTLDLRLTSPRHLVSMLHRISQTVEYISQIDDDIQPSM